MDAAFLFLPLFSHTEVTLGRSMFFELAASFIPQPFLQK
jgi:hypothetical protein